MSAPASQSDLLASCSEGGDVAAAENAQQPAQSQSASLPPDQAQALSKENLEDYETQLFGFTPKSFVSGIYNAVSEYFMEALQILEDYLQKQYDDTIARSEVGEKMTVIRKRLVPQIDKAFDTLEIYLVGNIFSVPTSMVLPEDQIQMDQPVSREDFLAMQQDIHNMKNNILAVKLANAVLKQRLQHTMEVRETLDAIVERLSSAQTTARQEGVVDLHGSLSHCAKTVLSTIRLLSNFHHSLDQDGPTQPKKWKSSVP